MASSVILESSAPHTPTIRTEIKLPNWRKRIDLSYSLHKEYVLTKEAVYIAFPSQPKSRNSPTTPRTDGSIPRMTNCPAAAASGMSESLGGRSRARLACAVVPYDAPLVNFGDIVRGNWPTDFAPRSGTIFSWLMNNYLGNEFCSGARRRFHLSLFNCERQRVSCGRVDTNWLGEHDAARIRCRKRIPRARADAPDQAGLIMMVIRISPS